MEQLKIQLDRFYRYIEIERRLSAHTVIAYKNDLNSFSDFIQDFQEVSTLPEIQASIIRAWIVELKDESKTNRTINRKISALKSFYNFLLKHHVVEKDITENIVLPKSEKKLPTFFSVKQMEQLFDHMIKELRDFQSYRDYLILQILYGTGIRQAELIGIKEMGVSKEYIKVLGKRNKERLVPITDELYSLIKDYVEIKKNEKIENEYLLVTDKGKKMYPKFVYRVVNKYINVVSTEQKRSPHTLRHSFATNTLNNGAQLHTVKEVLGHSSLAATQVYTHNSIERLKEAYKKFHPKEK